jgi:hypothetical protein
LGICKSTVQNWVGELKMIKLLDILTEANKETRIIPTRLQVALEHLALNLPEAKMQAINEIALPLIEAIGKLNNAPYNYNTMTTWKFTWLSEVNGPAMKLKEELTSMLTNPSEDLDVEAVNWAIKSIDELYIY